MPWRRLPVNRIIKIIFIISAIVIAFIYSLDLRNDYYFFLTKRKVSAEITEIKEISPGKNYIMSVCFFNEYESKIINCDIKLSRRVGKDILQKKVNSIPIYYTKKRNSKLYIEEYDKLTIGAVILHLLVFAISIYGLILFLKTKNVVSS